MTVSNYDEGDDWYRVAHDEDESEQGLVIPVESLSSEAIQGLIEEFVSRDGTDYGPHEVSFESRIDQVRRQLAKGHVSVVFDLKAQAANLVLTRDLSRMNVINSHNE